ncbi:hypothetical protein [Streptomyces sp. NPDC001315]|uniref:hypothetical protein n=1 Tax=Streptomyces sp. NPDC001315 TaxID=3364562 RepID=UPI00369BAD2B
MAEQKSSSALSAPVRSAASTLRRVPGAGVVSRAAGGALDKVGAVSPRGRRLAVYTGAGVLGVAGVVEWPVALTGAAVAWLTQPRPEQRSADAGEQRQVSEPDVGPEIQGDKEETGDTVSGSRAPKEGPGPVRVSPASTQGADHGGHEPAEESGASGHGRRRAATVQASTGHLGPTARPSRTTL